MSIIDILNCHYKLFEAVAKQLQYANFVYYTFCLCRDPKHFMNKKYEKAMIEAAAQWFSDGNMVDSDNILPLNYDNLSNEMIMILVFSM